MRKILITLVALNTVNFSSFAAGISPEDIMGSYTGKKGCIVRIEEYPGNMLEITMIRKGQVVAQEYLAKYRVEMISDDGDFEVKQDYVGFAGDETKVIKGEMKNFRLESIELTRRQSAFTQEQVECKELARNRR